MKKKLKQSINKNDCKLLTQNNHKINFLILNNFKPNILIKQILKTQIKYNEYKNIEWMIINY